MEFPCQNMLSCSFSFYKRTAFWKLLRRCKIGLPLKIDFEIGISASGVINVVPMGMCIV